MKRYSLYRLIQDYLRDIGTSVGEWVKYNDVQYLEDPRTCEGCISSEDVAPACKYCSRVFKDRYQSKEVK